MNKSGLFSIEMATTSSKGSSSSCGSEHSLGYGNEGVRKKSGAGSSTPTTRCTGGEFASPNDLSSVGFKPHKKYLKMSRSSLVVATPRSSGGARASDLEFFSHSNEVRLALFSILQYNSK